ncbi:MAG TPA: gluconate 2-dehydrogenase subunit 3 family protein [Gemmatimonadaceae bacterium]|jgi:hypothetical protein|nr:gluconate 2-dehydrogenase subunit 3 family protein [Gemmatimonadaceae bacterium]
MSNAHKPDDNSGRPATDADAGATHAAPGGTGGGVSRRTALGYLAALPLAGAVEFAPPTLERALRAVGVARDTEATSGAPYTPKFFTAHEWSTVRLLVDYVIPRDERSGSATEAGVPEFMDFIMGDKPDNQLWMRGGLAWLDLECERRFNATFLAATLSQRTQVLDAIAWPDKAAPDMRAGVAFFNRFRDMTASGFYTSKMGIADIQYMGNQMVPEWHGCPDAALTKLGVKYSDVYKS